MSLHFHFWVYYGPGPIRKATERQCSKCKVWQHNHRDGDGWKWGNF